MLKSESSKSIPAALIIPKLDTHQKNKFASVYDYKYEPGFTSKQIMAFGIEKAELPAFKEYVQMRIQASFIEDQMQAKALLDLYNKMLVSERKPVVKNIPPLEEIFTQDVFDRMFRNIASKDKLEELYELYKKNWSAAFDELYNNPKLIDIVMNFNIYASFNEYFNCVANTPMIPVSEMNAGGDKERNSSSTPRTSAALGEVSKNKNDSRRGSELSNLPKSDSIALSTSGGELSLHYSFERTSFSGSVYLEPLKSDSPSSNMPQTPVDSIRSALGVVSKRESNSRRNSNFSNLSNLSNLQKTTDSVPSTPGGNPTQRPRYSTSSSFFLKTPTEDKKPSSKKSWCCCS